jgi:hypothetical protein
MVSLAGVVHFLNSPAPLSSLATAIHSASKKANAWLKGEREFVLKPIPGPRVRESSLFDEAYQDQMFWGTYRPGFYCGTTLLYATARLAWPTALSQVKSLYTYNKTVIRRSAVWLLTVPTPALTAPCFARAL